MSHRHVISLLFLLSSPILPVAVYAQQSDSKPNENQVQPPSPPQVQSQSTPVQPERTPQQSDQARQQDRRNADDTRINPNWTTRQGNDERRDMERPRRADQDQEGRTVGRNWHRDLDEPERGYRDEDRYYEPRPRHRVKTCVEYENGDEFCRYRD